MSEAEGRSGAEAGQSTGKKQELKRAISRRLLIFFIVGDILGTGIYALVGEVGGSVGGAIWVSFLVAMIVAFMTAFSYAELVSKYPDAAGAALYVHKAFKMPFVTFIVAFAVVLSGITSASAAGTAFGGDYLTEFVVLPAVIVAIVFIVVLSIVNFIGIKESVTFNVVFTIVELSGLLLILIIGVTALVGGTGDPGRAMEFKGAGSIPLAIVAGASLAFFALVGFEDSVNVAEETHEPSKNFPRALFMGVAITGTVYVLVAFTASMVVPTSQLVGSSAPLLEVVKEGPITIPTVLFSLIALTAVTNSALINLIMGSRLLYGMANQGVIPSAFGHVHASRRTPIVAIVFIALIGIGLVSTQKVEALGAMTAAFLLAVFTLVNIVVLVLRRERVEHDHFKTPTVIPVLAAISCVLLLTKQEGVVLLQAGGLLLVGIVLWAVNRLVATRVPALRAEELS